LDFKREFYNRALMLLQDPRVAKLAQDPRVVSAAMGALKLRADLQRNLEDGARQLASSLHLATQSEVSELRRAVARLERELERARAQRRDRPEDRSSS
jgi:polyhydroxyalkanoate synthesis regulator phasin